MDQVTNAETSDLGWKSLYRVGGLAALIAGVLFRRNIAAEIGLFSQHTPPVTVSNFHNPYDCYDKSAPLKDK